jgi:hypothetical protein
MVLGDEEAVGYLIVKDQDGNEVDDEDIVDAARRVYDASSELINPLLIPGLNDILYKGHEFPLERDQDQEVYEEHGWTMMRAAYIVVAYSGLGKVRGKDLVVYPTDRIDIYNSYFGCPTFEMNIQVEKL